MDRADGCVCFVERQGRGHENQPSALQEMDENAYSDIFGSGSVALGGERGRWGPLCPVTSASLKPSAWTLWWLPGAAAALGADRLCAGPCSDS